MTMQLVVDEIVEAACKATGLDRFDSESFREGLGVLVEDINKGDTRTDEQKAMMRQGYVTALANRLRIHAYHESRPDLKTRPIQQPIFVFGVPRTGTTMLSNLLACDPAHRSPLTWEIDEPVPPATSETLYNDPRALKRLEQERQMLAAMPEMGKYYRGSAIYPNECVFVMAADFKTLMWESQGDLPLYREYIFDKKTDVTSAYQYHKYFLQVLQADAPGIWNLKKPSHILFIEQLLKVYPDAKLVWTHRDPYAATGSFCSLLAMGQRRYSISVDPLKIGRNYSWQAIEHARRGMEARERIGHDRIVDVHYADMMRDPIGVMRKLYADLGDPFTPEAEAGMQAWIDDNPQDKFGRHEYKLAQYGLSVDELAPLWEDYFAQYDVEREG